MLKYLAALLLAVPSLAAVQTVECPEFPCKVLVTQQGVTPGPGPDPDPDPDPGPIPDPDPLPDPDPTPSPDPLPPGDEFRGIPKRPYADVATGAATVETGASACIGTPEQPAFMVGGKVTGDNYAFQAEYCIIDGVESTARFKPSGFMVEMRNMHVHDTDRVGISVNGTDMAVVNSYVHNARGNNAHGVSGSCNTKRLWVEGNTFEYNDEDGFQIGHECTGAKPDEIYFYGNTCNNNRENCFDVKYAERVVVSGNSSANHRSSGEGVFTYDDGSTGGNVNSKSDGTAFLPGSDGGPNVLFMFDNVSTNDRICVRIEEAGTVHIDGMKCLDTAAAGFKADKKGHTHITNTTQTGGAPFLNTTWRQGIHISESDNEYDGEYRQGKAGTVDNSPTDINTAYQAAFGRAP